MKPSDTGAHYDAIARQWQEETSANYGIAQLERAITFIPKPQGAALDVGCGSEGRFLKCLGTHGFTPEGLDISPKMIELARLRYPEVVFHTADICEWEFPHTYAFISAWDSTFHLPIEAQKPVLRKLCAGLSAGGIFLFTCGGGEAGEITGAFWQQDFGYSTLGVERFVQLLHECGCFIRHVEYDQHPENHVYVIAQKK